MATCRKTPNYSSHFALKTWTIDIFATNNTIGIWKRSDWKLLHRAQFYRDKNNDLAEFCVQFWLLNIFHEHDYLLLSNSI